MADIFISYSRKDSEHALKLKDLLGSAGHSVWLDNTSIAPSTSWSREIVTAIEHCRVMIVLLSHHSILSHNVIKEVSLASEKRKQIVPIELHPLTTLTEELQYLLAGVQRCSIDKVDDVLKLLEVLGLRAVESPAMRLMQGVIGRKSLMILPFEDLSPQHDNQWFTDGMTSELIGTLSNVKTLRLIDWNTSREFRDRQVRTVDLARELKVRYFIEGQVRKFGDQLKISVTLFDVESEEYIWQVSLMGSIEDVFQIQEQVAMKAVKGLELHLSTEEQLKIQERGTESPEAYTLYLKAREFATRDVRADKLKAIVILTEVLQIDPNYARALHEKAHNLMVLYYVYDRDPAHLVEAEVLVKRALESVPTLWPAYGTLTMIYWLGDRPKEAEETALEYVRLAPYYYDSHSALGQYYSFAGRDDLAIGAYERALEFRPDNYMVCWNLVGSARRIGDHDRVVDWARRALPLYEQRLRLVPDDEHRRVQYASLLERAGEPDRACTALDPLLVQPNLDPVALYNAAALLVRLDRNALAIDTLNRSLDAGLNYPEIFTKDPDLEPLRGSQEFGEILKRVELKAVI